jgi:hypothetical protein
MMRGNVTTSRTRGTRGAIGDKSSSSCSYATINKKEMGQKLARPLTARWRRDGSPGGIGSTIVGVAAMMTTTRRRRQRQQRWWRALGATWEWTRLRHSGNVQQREANAVDANIDVDISVSQLLHQEVMVTTVGAMSSRWRWDGATRVGGGRHDESSWSKEGAVATTAAVGRQRGQRNESGRGAEWGLQQRRRQRCRRANIGR